LDGTDLKRGVIEPEGFPIEYLPENEAIKVLGKHIQNGSEPIFYYFNEGWPTDTANNPLVEASRLSDTKFIQVSLKVNADPDRPTGEYLLQPYVQLRNLKDNL